MAKTLSGLFTGPSAADVRMAMGLESDARIRQAGEDAKAGGFIPSYIARARQKGVEALQPLMGAGIEAFGGEVPQDPRLAKALKRDKDKKFIIDELGKLAGEDKQWNEAEMMEGYKLLMERGYPEEARKFLADAKIMVDMERTKAAAEKDRRPTSGRKLQKGHVWTVPTGDGSGRRKVLQANVVFHQDKGEVILNRDGSFSPLPEGAERTVPSIMSKATMNETDFDKKATKIKETHQSLKRLVRYAKNIQKGGHGLKFMVNKFLSAFKTASNRPLTAEQLAAFAQQGEFDALIGRFRVETLGPGVMTKADAEMIARALGGDPSMWRSPQAVGYHLKNLFLDKMDFLKQDLAMYNEQIKRPGRSSWPELKMPDFDMTPFDDLINPATNSGQNNSGFTIVP